MSPIRTLLSPNRWKTGIQTAAQSTVKDSSRPWMVIICPFGRGGQAMTEAQETIAILGGTGDLGTGLAIRWARAGHRIIIGSRTLEKAQQAVAALKQVSPQTPAEAMVNRDAAAAGSVIVLTVPFEHQLQTLAGVREGLVGKVLIDVTVPLRPPKVGTVQLPPEGSAGKRAQDFLGTDVDVVSAFQNVAADLLQQDVTIECDVLVSGNTKAARERVIGLVRDAGMQGWHAGPIENAAAAEALTSVLIQINRSKALSHAGIRIVGQDAH
jgi:8-hydroxy-5-deazaflavin:NADPH oxidoreductase